MIDDTGLKVFVSYARLDSSFVDDLVAALGACGLTPFLDRHDIAAGEAWEMRLEELIRTADTVVAVVSPHFLASERCNWEIDLCRRLGKRLIPILATDIEIAALPLAISTVQLIPFAQRESYGRSLASLVQYLKTDIEWIREHTRLGELARRWHGTRAVDRLLRGVDIEAADEWLLARPAGNEKPTELHEQFIRASKSHASRARNALISRLAIAVAVFASIASVALWLAFHAKQLQRVAEAQRNLALIAQSNFIAELALQELDAGDPSTASLFALEALPRPGFAAGERPLVPAAERALYASVTSPRREIAVMGDHDNIVGGVVFDPTGKLLATASYDGTARLRDASSGETRAILRGHTDNVWAVNFSKDSKFLVTGSWDGTVRVWDVQSGSPLQNLRHSDGSQDHQIRTVDFSSDGKYVFAISDSLIIVWRTSDWKEHERIDLSGLYGEWAWSRISGGLAIAIVIATEEKKRTIRIAKVENETTQYDIELDRVGDARIELKAIINEGRDFVFNTVRHDNSSITTLLKNVDKTHYDKVEISGLTMAVSPNGTHLIVKDAKGATFIWRLHDGASTNALPGRDVTLMSTTFSPDSTLFAQAYVDGVVNVYQTNGEAMVASLVGHEARIYAVAFSPDGIHLATAAEDGSARLWHLSPHTMPGTYLKDTDGVQFSGPTAVASSGNLVAAQMEGHKIRIWDGKTSKALHTIDAHSDSITGLAFSTDARSLVTVSKDASAKVWDVSKGTMISIFRASVELNAVALFPDNERAITAASGGKLLIWSLARGEIVGSFDTEMDEVSQIGVALGGARIIAQASDGTIGLWDTQGFARIATYRDKAPQRKYSGSAADSDLVRYHQRPTFAIGPDTRMAITDETGYDILIVDLTAGDVAARLKSSRHFVEQIAFSGSGKLIFSAAENDNEARLWDVETGAVKHRFDKRCGDVPHCDYWIVRFRDDDRQILTVRWKTRYKGSESILIDVERGEVIANSWQSSGELQAAWFVASGTRLFVAASDDFARAPSRAGFWSIPTATTQAIFDAETGALRCLTEEQRVRLYLPKEPPTWCITNRKWPYATHDWQRWLELKSRGVDAPLPHSRDWASWNSTNKDALPERK